MPAGLDGNPDPIRTIERDDVLRAIGERRGATSADGYYLDSHQLEHIVDELLNPFRRGADHVLVAAFDEPADSPLEILVDVAPNAVLVFDGLSVHRPEFAELWDVSVFG